MSTVLETINLVKTFGGLVATDNVCLKVQKGARLALIGPNGAGKTTLVNLLTGLLRPTSGKILLHGQDIGDLEPHKRVHLGMARTFQINQLFGDLTPVETIGLAVCERMGRGTDWWRLPGTEKTPIGRENMFGLLAPARALIGRLRIRLWPRKSVPAGE